MFVGAVRDFNYGWNKLDIYSMVVNVQNIVNWMGDIFQKDQLFSRTFGDDSTIGVQCSGTAPESFDSCCFLIFRIACTMLSASS